MRMTFLIRHIKTDDTDNPSIPDNIGYHRGCYIRFTCIAKIQRAKERLEKFSAKNEDGKY